MAAKVGEYLLLETIGHGAFGKVKLGVHQETGERVAVKIMDKGDIQKQDLTQNVRREITIMKALKHKNIVRLYQVLTTNSKIYVVMELVTGGELFDVISKHRHGLKEKAARRYFQQLVDGVVYCHKRKVYHRDLKPENILLSEAKEVKVTDFGLSSITRSKHGERDERFLKTQCGTPCYVAPEVIYAASEGYSGEKADGWACGVVLYALLTGSLPFDSDELGELFMMIINNEPHYPEHLSKGAKDLLMKMLHKDPKKRINLRQVRDHPWFLRNYETEAGEDVGRPRRKRKVGENDKSSASTVAAVAAGSSGVEKSATETRGTEVNCLAVQDGGNENSAHTRGEQVETNLVANTVAMFEEGRNRRVSGTRVQAETGSLAREESAQRAKSVEAIGQQETETLRTSDNSVRPVSDPVHATAVTETEADTSMDTSADMSADTSAVTTIVAPDETANEELSFNEEMRDTVRTSATNAVDFNETMTPENNKVSLDVEDWNDTGDLGESDAPIFGKISSNSALAEMEKEKVEFSNDLDNDMFASVTNIHAAHGETIGEAVEELKDAEADTDTAVSADATAATTVAAGAAQTGFAPTSADEDRVTADGDDADTVVPLLEKRDKGEIYPNPMDSWTSADATPSASTERVIIEEVEQQVIEEVVDENGLVSADVTTTAIEEKIVTINTDEISHELSGESVDETNHFAAEADKNALAEEDSLDEGVQEVEAFSGPHEDPTVGDAEEETLCSFGTVDIGGDVAQSLLGDEIAKSTPEKALHGTADNVPEPAVSAASGESLLAVVEATGPEVTRNTNVETGETTDRRFEEAKAMDVAEAPAEEAFEEVIETITNDTAEVSAEETAILSAQGTLEEIREATEAVVEDATEEGSGMVIAAAADVATDTATGLAMAAATGESSKEATEEVADIAQGETTHEATEETTRDFAGEIAGQTLEEVKVESAEVATDEAADEETEVAVEVARGEPAEEPEEEPGEEPGEEFTEELVEKPAEALVKELAEESLDMATEEVTAVVEPFQAHEQASRHVSLSALPQETVGDADVGQEHTWQTEETSTAINDHVGPIDSFADIARVVRSTQLPIDAMGMYPSEYDNTTDQYPIDGNEVNSTFEGAAGGGSSDPDVVQITVGFSDNFPTETDLAGDDEENDDEVGEGLQNMTREEVGEFYAVRRLQTFIAMAKTTGDEDGPRSQVSRMVALSGKPESDNTSLDDGDRKETLQALQTVKSAYMSRQNLGDSLSMEEQNGFKKLLELWESKLQDGSSREELFLDEDLLTPFQKLLRYWDQELTGKYAAEEVEDVVRASSINAETESEFGDDELTTPGPTNDAEYDEEIIEEIQEYEVYEGVDDDDDEGRVIREMPNTEDTLDTSSNEHAAATVEQDVGMFETGLDDQVGSKKAQGDIEEREQGIAEQLTLSSGGRVEPVIVPATLSASNGDEVANGELSRELIRPGEEIETGRNLPVENADVEKPIEIAADVDTVDQGFQIHEHPARGDVGTPQAVTEPTGTPQAVSEQTGTPQIVTEPTEAQQIAAEPIAVIEPRKPLKDTELENRQKPAAQGAEDEEDSGEDEGRMAPAQDRRDVRAIPTAFDRHKQRNAARGQARVPVTQSVVMDSARFKTPIMQAAIMDNRVSPKIPIAGRENAVKYAVSSQESSAPSTPISVTPRTKPVGLRGTPRLSDEQGKKQAQKNVVSRWKSILGLSVKRYSQFNSGFSPDDALQEMGKLFISEGHNLTIRTLGELKLTCSVDTPRGPMMVVAEFIPSKSTGATTVLLRQSKPSTDTVTFNRFFDHIRDCFALLRADAVLS